MADPHADPVIPADAGNCLDDVLEVVEAGAYAVNGRGEIVAVSRGAERLLGRTAKDLLGRDAHDLLHRDGGGRPLARAGCPMLRAISTGRTAAEQAGWMAGGDESVLSVLWLAAPFRHREETTGALVIFQQCSDAEADRQAGLAAASLSELERLALLAETTSRLSATLDPDEALRRLAQIVVPRLADWVIVDVLEEKETRRSLVASHSRGTVEQRPDLCGPLPPVSEDSPLPLSRALRGAASTLATPATYAEEPEAGIGGEQRRLFEVTGITSAAVGPIQGPRELLGALTLGRTEGRSPFTDADLSLLRDVARRTGNSLENARLYQRQRRVAETMQHHLLPKLPAVEGVETTVRYVSAPDASRVGGDWYDMFALSDGSFALAIGDVAGHDLEAAAGMAQVRNMLRAHAWARHGEPGETVRQLDETVRHVTDVSMATLVFGHLAHEPRTGWRVTWTNAGHPPPLLVEAHGMARFLSAAHGLLLGTGTSPERPNATTALPPQSTLLLYTDGLVESRNAPLDDGLERLRQHAAALADSPLDAFCDQLLQRVRPAANDDDVALLALRVPSPPCAG